LVIRTPGFPARPIEVILASRFGVGRAGLDLQVVLEPGLALAAFDQTSVFGVLQRFLFGRKCPAQFFVILEQGYAISVLTV
jgi:hypothetical protein